MKLADKILKLRKQFGLSQEELAEKMNVSRQSVSKWESANSIPDLNKILMLAEIFGVSTDYLLKDEIERPEKITETAEDDVKMVTLEMASQYIESKISASKFIVTGLMFVLFSPVPLLLMKVIQYIEGVNISNNLAAAFGLLMLFLMVSVGVSFFIKSNGYTSNLFKYETEEFELVYGVKSILKEKLDMMKGEYQQKLSLSIFAFISSSVPLIVVSILIPSRMLVYSMLVVLFLMIGGGLYVLIPVSTRFNAYSVIVGEGQYAPENKEKYSFMSKIGVIYWSTVLAIYLGWSFYTMSWGTTWIVWPVFAVLFGAVIGIAELMRKK